MQTIRKIFAGAFPVNEVHTIQKMLSRLAMLIIMLCALSVGNVLKGQTTLTDPPASQNVLDCHSEFTYTIPYASQSAWQVSGGTITQGGTAGSTTAKVTWDLGFSTGWIKATYLDAGGVGGATIVTGQVNVTIDPPTPGSLNTVTPICYNTTPTITSATLPGPTGSAPTYIWQHSVGMVTGSEHPSAISWQTISQSGPFDKDYTPPAPLTASKYYRRGATVCNTTVYSAAVFVEVYDQLNPGTISVNFDCNSGTASLSATDATGGNTTSSYTYVWQSKPSSGGSWTTASTSITSLSVPTEFRRLASSGTCGESLPSTEIEVKPQDLIQNQSLDLSQEVFCYEEQPFVKLNTSQSLVDYELYLDGSPTGSIQAGAGAALTWNVTTGGAYTVMAVNNTACGPIAMTGTANLVVNVPVIYDVTGGGNICPGITSDISLSGSDTGAKYYLKLGSTVLLSSEKDGNGYPLEWCSIDVEGTYTVVAKQGTCNYRDMNNLSDPIVEIGTPATPVVTGNYTTTLNGSVTLSTQAETGVNYTWYDLNGKSVGTGSSLTLSNMDDVIELVVVADNGGCSISAKITAGYVVVQSPTVNPQLTAACGHYYLQKSGSPAANHTWYWQGKNPEGKEQLIDAELYDYRVATSGTYYLRSFNELAGVWADQPMSISVNLTDPTTIKPTSCSDITAMQVADEPGAYTSGTYNYVRSYDVFTETDQQLTETAAENAILNETDHSKVQQATQYVDGLGRPLQTVSRKASPGNKDMIQAITYDEYGRPTRQYLPYTAQDATGELRLDPFGDQEDFYQGATGITAHFPNEQVLYGESLMEKSPLNRAKLTSAPGDAWTGNRVGAMADWRINTATEGIRRWTIATNPQTTSTYAAGELYVTVTTDENGSQVKEFANAKGQQVLKQVQSADAGAPGHSDWFNTYYIYNTYNQLAFVLPPRAVELLEAHNWNWINADVYELIFSYIYDGRNRMITKQVPGSGRVDMVYDKLDRLVATQDANQRAINQWTFTKYDALNRPVLTGFVTLTSNRSQLQSITSGWSGDLHVKRQELSTNNVLEGATITTSVRDTEIGTYRAKNTGYVDYLPGFTSETNADFDTELVASLSHEYTAYEGYHDATFPLLATSSFEMNTVNYYDDYDFTAKTWDNGFDGKGFYTTPQEKTDYNYVAPEQFEDSQGLATGSKVRILGTDDWLTSVMFYDNRGRVVQTQGENQMGGTDISTTQYDFAGRVLHTYTIHNNPQALANNTTRILKRFSYDHAGRLETIQEKLNDTGSLNTLTAHAYNALGELESKVLGDNLESLDYKYNVRGWLKSINGDYVAGTNNTHFFGMDLSYEFGFEQNQLNGNIAGITWRSKSSTKTRAYGFDYDNTNRLLMADYHQNDGVSNAWSQATADFSTSYGYDANGNILNLNRQGVVAGTITTIDQLTYNYGAGYNLAGNSNQLVAVADAMGDLGQGDFKDVVNATDYEYDLNGNMKDDMNKGITNITYNHLNLPVVVSFGSTKSITYTYDAAGIKLSKLVNDNGSLTTTDYAGGFIYEDNDLQHFAHEEGRVRKNNAGNLVHDYFIKDHLGNTRMTLTEATEVVEYRASMETGSSQGVDMQSYEESIFLNLPAVRSSLEPLGNTTDVPDIVDDKSARLNGYYSGTRIGPAKMMVVSAGDQINVSVDSYHAGAYNDTGYHNQTTIKSALSTVLGTGAVNATEANGISTIVNGLSPSSTAVFVGGDGTQNRPKAYLNVLIFDQDFNYEGGEYQQTDQLSGYKTLTINKTMAEGGYVYVYLSNESQTDFNVYFDDLEIVHTKGAILQEDHYYPFGMNINALSSSAALSKPNRFKFGSQELQHEFDLNWYQYRFRNHDPQTGRFFNIDPLTDKFFYNSPYAFAENKLGLGIEFEGLELFQARGVVRGEKNGKVLQSSDWAISSNQQVFMALTVPNGPKETLYQTPGNFFQAIRGIMNNSPNRGLLGGLIMDGIWGLANDATTTITDTANDLGLSDLPARNLEGDVASPSDIIDSGVNNLTSLFLFGAAKGAPPLKKGSGPSAGVLEVSTEVKSVAQFKNYNPKNPIEFLFDFKTNTFVVGNVKKGVAAGLSPHQKLTWAIGSQNKNVVGGMFKRGKNGAIMTNEFSGHYWQNWTDDIRQQFTQFLETQTGQSVIHNNGLGF
ncbi:MAG: hypothetical protein HEP71_09260 [Roseivirga sp.]|nr:hypothetical protein [Roseivirga sp.]